MDLQKDVPGLCSEMCLSSSHDENQVINIKVEATDIQEDEHPMLITFPVIKAEHKATLNQHQPICDEECPYSCDVCNKSFNQKSNLKIHQRTHSGERPYSSDVCNNKSFGHKSNLKIHQRAHSGERPYTCDVYNKSFTHKDHLMSHHHISSVEHSCDVFNKSFCCDTCDVCDKSFSQRYYLNKHQHTHTGELSYSCDVCNK